MRAVIVLLPGDGIGPEVVREGQATLAAVAERFGHDFLFTEHLVGGTAIDATGTALPPQALEACAAQLTAAGVPNSGAIEVPPGAILNFKDPDGIALALFWDRS